MRVRHAHLPAACIAKFFLLNVQGTRPRFLAHDGIPKETSSPAQDRSSVTWDSFSVD